MILFDFVVFDMNLSCEIFNFYVYVCFRIFVLVVLWEFVDKGSVVSCCKGNVIVFVIIEFSEIVVGLILVCD